MGRRIGHHDSTSRRWRTYECRIILTQYHYLQCMYVLHCDTVKRNCCKSCLAVRRPREETGLFNHQTNKKRETTQKHKHRGLRTGWWFYDNWPFFDNYCSGVGEKAEWHVDLEQKIIENSCINETRNICFNFEMIFVPWPVLPMRGSINCCFCEPSGAWSLKLFCAPKSISSYSTTSSLLL